MLYKYSVSLSLSFLSLFFSLSLTRQRVGSTYSVTWTMQISSCYSEWQFKIYKFVYFWKFSLIFSSSSWPQVTKIMDEKRETSYSSMMPWVSLDPSITALTQRSLKADKEKQAISLGGCWRESWEAPRELAFPFLAVYGLTRRPLLGFPLAGLLGAWIVYEFPKYLMFFCLIWICPNHLHSLRSFPKPVLPSKNHLSPKQKDSSHLQGEGEEALIKASSLEGSPICLVTLSFPRHSWQGSCCICLRHTHTHIYTCVML